MNYDVIGDVHGQAAKLRALLGKMGYRETGGAWRKPGHTAIFVGDFVDRGPNQIETVTIARRMVDAGSALALMGNHEFNAIAFYLPDPEKPGDRLRRWNDKNWAQHKNFLMEVLNTPKHGEIVDWFLTLPLWLELPEFRVVHACWHPAHMRAMAPRLESGNRLNRDLVESASRLGHPDFVAVECLIKGLEVELPKGVSFPDKEGHIRTNVRVRWWDPTASTFRSAAVPAKGLDPTVIPDTPLPEYARLRYADDKPVFFGHYWMRGAPALQSPKAACVDYSAAEKGQPLVAYRWQGESELNAEHFISGN